MSDQPPPRRLDPRIEQAFKSLETLFEVGASALVPIATLLFPLVLAAISFLVVPFGPWKHPVGDSDAGDEAYVSIAPFTGEAGDTPEPQPEEATPAPPAPATKGEPEPPTGKSTVPTPDTTPGPVTPEGPGTDDATAPGTQRGDEQGTAPKPVPAGLHVVKGGKVRQCVEVPNPEITKIGDGKFTIERRLVDYYATHIRALDSLGWVEHWKSDDGSEKGFRVGGVKCSSDLYLAGFRNGDIVTHINDARVGSIPEAIAVYARFRGSDVIRIEFLRHGEQKVHLYRLK